MLWNPCTSNPSLRVSWIGLPRQTKPSVQEGCDRTYLELAMGHVVEADG